MKKSEKNHLNYIIELWRLVGKSQKLNILKLIILSLIISIFEIINVATVIPIITLIINGEKQLINLNFVQLLISNFNWIEGYITARNIIITFMIITTLVFILKIVILKIQNFISFELGENINKKIFNNLIMQDYLKHKTKNSSEYITLITTKSQSIIINTIQPLITLVSLIIISTFLIFITFNINHKFGLLVLITSVICYSIVIYNTKKIVYKNSIMIDRKSSELVKIINETIGSIKDIIINKHQKYLFNKYSDINKDLKTSQAQNNIIANMPRPFVEYILMLVIISYLTFSSIYGDNNTSDLPSIVAILYSIQRLIPLLQQIYYNFNSIKSSKESLINIIKVINSKVKISDYGSINLDFKNSIKFENVSFKYPDTEKWILKDITCEILRGESVGLFGKSGAGKTTFIDLLMGLIRPTSGKILIDNVELVENNINSWHSKITHVPQKIYLTDESIIDNIIFGQNSSKINKEKLDKSIEMTELLSIIKEFNKTLYANIGERADKISGGQIQRIAIARALYKDSEIIILDESTNALDKISEYEILKKIKNEYINKNFIIITHREDLLKLCTKIIKFDQNDKMVY